MTTLLVIVWIGLAVLLVMLQSIRPQRAKHSVFELERLGGKEALRRERLLDDIVAIRRFLILLITLLFGVTSFALWKSQGVIGAAALLFLVVPLSRWKFIHSYAMKLYAAQEKRLFRMIDRAPWVSWFVREDKWINHDLRLESVEHLLHLVESAGHVLTPDQQHIIRRGVKWHTKTLGDVMTKRKDVVTVAKGELLGPLVLDDLHKTGHTRFPVVQKDLDHTIGLINISELFEVDADKHSQTAEKYMTPLNIRASRDTLLPDALKQLLAYPNQIILVTDDEGRSVGIATFSDILNALLSHR